MMLQVSQCLVCFLIIHLVSTAGQWSNDGKASNDHSSWERMPKDPPHVRIHRPTDNADSQRRDVHDFDKSPDSSIKRANADRQGIDRFGLDSSVKEAHPRIFFEEAEQESIPNGKETSEEMVSEKKSPGKSVDVKTSESALSNEKDETRTVSQTREENSTKSRTNPTRRHKKKDKASKKETTHSPKRKPRKKHTKKTSSTTPADEEEDATEAAQPAVKTTRPHRSNAPTSIPNKNKPHKSQEPLMTSLHYDTTVRSRYLRTTITASIVNPGAKKEININVILPRRAIITKFATWINNKLTTATVEGFNTTINEADTDARGINVGTQLVRARDCDAVAFSVPFHGRMSYTITYEYLLERYLGLYRIPMYIHTNQWIEDLSATWRIHEDRNLSKLQTPLIHSPNSLPVDNSDDPWICLTHEEPGIAELVWQPTIEEQKNISRSLNGKGKGVVGVLKVNYDVARTEDLCGEVVRQKKWFAHFYAPPPDNSAHAKHVVFVLDVSKSTEKKALEQLKMGINSYLGKLKSKADKFTVINSAERARATLVNSDTARKSIRKIHARNQTNVFDDLYMAFKAVIDSKLQKPKQKLKGLNEPHFIVFVHDGRVRNPRSKDLILDMVKYLYRLTGASIFALGLGPEVDRDLMRKLAAITNGKEKHIYRGADTHRQVAEFLDSVNSPVRTHYSAKFDPKQVITSSLTQQTAKVAFRGTEIPIAGQLSTNLPDPSKINVDISTRSDLFIDNCEKQHLNLRKSEAYEEATFTTAASINGSSKHFPPVVPKSIGTVAKIWAFKTLIDLRAKIESNEAFERPAEAKAEYGDAISFHQPTLCDDPFQPNERIIEIALRFKYAVSRVTNLIYNNIVLQRIGIDPDAKLDAKWNIHFAARGAKNRSHTKPQLISIRRSFTDVDEETDDDVPSLSCNNSVHNRPGECRLISDCPDIRLYTTEKIFRKHVCQIGITTGVCCPKSVPRPMQYIE